jgi:hypothetical protein
MLMIDSGNMLCAVSAAAASVGLPESKAFLHRSTGQIVFFHEKESDDESCGGPHAMVDAASNRARVAASPDEWLAIPKYLGPSWDRRTDEDDDSEEAFICRFLAEHGIDATFE